jgi:hypothetical protein
MSAILDQTSPENTQLTNRTLALMFVAVVGAAWFAVALSYLFIFMAEIGGNNRTLQAQHQYTNHLCHAGSSARF